jgi:hypothetical protein
VLRFIALTRNALLISSSIFIWRDTGCSEALRQATPKRRYLPVHGIACSSARCRPRRAVSVGPLAPAPLSAPSATLSPRCVTLRGATRRSAPDARSAPLERRTESSYRDSVDASFRRPRASAIAPCRSITGVWPIVPAQATARALLRPGFLHTMPAVPEVWRHRA